MFQTLGEPSIIAPDHGDPVADAVDLFAAVLNDCTTKKVSKPTISVSPNPMTAKQMRSVILNSMSVATSVSIFSELVPVKSRLLDDPHRCRVDAGAAGLLRNCSKRKELPGQFQGSRTGRKWV